MRNPLVSKRVELEAKIAALKGSQSSRLEPLRNWISEANALETTVSRDDWPGMKQMLQKVGSNRLLRGQKLTVSFAKPWNVLAETTIAVRSTTSKAVASATWWRLLDEVRTFFDAMAHP